MEANEGRNILAATEITSEATAFGVLREDGWANGFWDVSADGSMDESMGGSMGGSMNEWMDGWMDGKVDG